MAQPAHLQGPETGIRALQLRPGNFFQFFFWADIKVRYGHSNNIVNDSSKLVATCGGGGNLWWWWWQLVVVVVEVSKEMVYSDWFFLTGCSNCHLTCNFCAMSDTPSIISPSFFASHKGDVALKSLASCWWFWHQISGLRPETRELVWTEIFWVCTAYSSQKMPVKEASQQKSHTYIHYLAGCVQCLLFSPQNLGFRKVTQFSLAHIFQPWVGSEKPPPTSHTSPFTIENQVVAPWKTSEFPRVPSSGGPIFLVRWTGARELVGTWSDLQNKSPS